MEKQNIFRILTYNIKKVMKQTTLLIAIIAILTSCSKDENLLPVQQQSDNPSLKVSGIWYYLDNIEETKYNINDIYYSIL